MSRTPTLLIENDAPTVEVLLGQDGEAQGAFEIVEHAIVEALPLIEDGQRREAWVDLIVEGFGNPRDGHYYGRQLLEQFAKSFEGAKMYANHLSREAQQRLEGLPRDIQDVQGRILEAKFVERADGRGAIRGRVNVLQDWLWNMVKRDPGILGVSINARGSSRPGTVEAREAKIVEAITDVRSVDWVTEAGAGGQVVAFVEAQVREQQAAEEETAAEPPEDAAAANEGPETAAVEGDDEEWLLLDDTPAMLSEGDEDEDPEGEELEEAVWQPWMDDIDVVNRQGDLNNIPNRRDRGRVPTHGVARDDTPGWTQLTHAIEAARTELTEHDAQVPDELTVEAFTAVVDAVVEAELANQAAQLNESARNAATAAYKAAEEVFTEALEKLEADHAGELAQIEQRYQAAAIIESFEVKPGQHLPAASQRRLKEQFHDELFVAEIGEDGKTVTRTAEQVLKDAVEAACKEKLVEMGAFAEARVTGAGEGTELREAGQPKAAPARGAAPRRNLDADIDSDLDIDRAANAAQSGTQQ